MTDLDSLKNHIDQKFDNLAEVDRLKHDRIEERMDEHSESIKENKTAVRRVHSRVDEINTKIKTVQGIGTAIATALGAAAAWIGLTGRS